MSVTAEVFVIVWRAEEDNYVKMKYHVAPSHEILNVTLKLPNGTNATLPIHAYHENLYSLGGRFTDQGTFYTFEPYCVFKYDFSNSLWLPTSVITVDTGYFYMLTYFFNNKYFVIYTSSLESSLFFCQEQKDKGTGDYTLVSITNNIRFISMHWLEGNI